MFRTKSRTEQLQDHADSLATSASSVADQLRERVFPAVGQATDSAREWAKPHVERGIEVAAPRLESAVSGLAPKVDTARDKIVEDLIPRVAEAISAWAIASAAVKDEAISRGQGAAAVVSGDAVATPRGRKKKRVLIVLGVLAAAAAAATAVMRKSAPKDDPWTTPIADPYVATSNGRHSAGGRADESAAETAAPSPLDPSGDHSLTVDDAADADAKDATDTADDVNGKAATDKKPHA